MSSGPQLVAGRYVTPAAVPLGQVRPLLLDSFGRVIVVGGGGGGAVVVVGTDTPSDAKANPTDNVKVTTFAEGWNGATWDRLRAATLTGAYQVLTAGAGWAEVAANLAASDGASIRTLLMNSVMGGLNVLPYWQNAATGGYAPAQMNGQARAYAVPCPQNPSDTAGDPALSATLDDAAVTVKASAGWLLAFDVTNEGAAAYFQVFNKASDPILGDVPVLSIPVRSGSTGPVETKRSREELAGGKRFATGIAHGWSSTKATYTAAAFTGCTNVFYI